MSREVSCGQGVRKKVPRPKRQQDTSDGEGEERGEKISEAHQHLVDEVA